MTLRSSLSTLLLLAICLPAWAAGVFSKDDNIIISDELRVYTLNEKDGRLKSVKVESDTYYEALEKNGYAYDLTIYNDEITIDKASAPDAKPYYRSMESKDIFYDGSRVCFMEIPVSKGKKVKATVHQTYKSPEHFCNVSLYSGAYFTKNSKVVIKVPAAIASSIKVTPYKFTDNITLSSETLANGSVVYTAEGHDMKTWSLDEKDAPSPSVAAPRIIITGQFGDATSLYRHFKTYCEDIDYEDSEICRVATMLREKTDNDRALIDSTAAWVRQNIRYLAVEHGEYAFKPSSPSETIRSKAGDCKGSANLIKALLKKNGLDGRLVWIGTQGDIPFDWDEVPALCSGNHVIAACMYGDSVIYLDGTTTWSSPGYLPPSIRGRRVMMENGEDCILSNVPTTGKDADYETRISKFSIDGNDLVGDMQIQLSGVDKMAFLSFMSSLEPHARKASLDKFIAYPKKNADVYDVKVNADLSKQTVDIAAKIRESNAAQNIGGKIYIDLKPLRDNFFEVVDTAKRTHDHLLPNDCARSFDFEIAIPEGYKVESMPESFEFENDWNSASIKYMEMDGKLLCNVSIATKELYTLLEKLPQRNEPVKMLRRIATSKIVLSKVSNQ